MARIMTPEPLQIFSVGFAYLLLISSLINFLLFLIVPNLTYLKPATPRKLYSVDLFRLPQQRQKEEKVVKREKVQTPPLAKDTENINTQAKELPQQEESRIYELGDLDEVPKILYTEKPKYPEQLRRNNITGKVILKFLVNYFGYVEQVIIAEPSVSELFDQSAVESIKRWRFSPPKVKGRSASVWFILPVKFELE